MGKVIKDLFYGSIAPIEQMNLGEDKEFRKVLVFWKIEIISRRRFWLFNREL